MYVFYYFQYDNNTYFAMQIYTKKNTQHAKVLFFLPTPSIASTSKMHHIHPKSLICCFDHIN